MNENVRSRVMLATVALLAIPTFGSVAAQRTRNARLSPPILSAPWNGPTVQPPRRPPRGTILAAVVRSWSGGSANGWRFLNIEWPNYGSTPIYIDSSLGGVSSFTYADLVATGADVIILSDPAGGGEQYSQVEVEALRRYVEGGHNLIGTFKVFSWLPSGVDNRALAPLFGLREDVTYSSSVSRISNLFWPVAETSLFRGLSMRPWLSSGYPFTEGSEESPMWTALDQAGAQIIAECDDGIAIVSIYRAPAYHGIFFSNMPEYSGSAIDRQLLYNAITYPLPEQVRTRSSPGVRRSGGATSP